MILRLIFHPTPQAVSATPPGLPLRTPRFQAHVQSQFLYIPYAPTLAYIVEQIGNGDPLKIGTQNSITTPFGTVPAGHARACYGYDTTGSQPLAYFSDSRLGTQGMLTYEVFVASNYNTYIGKT